MWKKRRHKVVVEIIRLFFVPYFKIKYKCNFDKKISMKEGALIVSNHLTTMDPFLIGVLFKDPLYYMASIDLFEHLFVGKLIKFLVNPIPKEKSKKSDLMAIRNCITVAKENGNICIFPEGNRTFSGELCHIDESIGKLAKLLKKPLIICNIEGGYGTDPRWGNKIRKGKMKVSIKKIYQYDEIKDLSADEIYTLIIEGITVDNYSFYNRYKYNKKAEYLERVLYICPKCGKMHTLYSDGNYIKCNSCGLEVEYKEDLTFKANDYNFKFKYIRDWYNYQIDVIKSLNYEDNKVIYQEDDINVTYSRLFNSKVKVGEGSMKLYNDRFVLSLKDKEITFNFTDIEACTVLGKKKLGIYINSKTYQIFGDKRINVLKYMHIFYHLKNKNEGKVSTFLGI